MIRFAMQMRPLFICVMSNNETAYKLFNVIITTSALHIAFKILSDVDDVLFTTIYRECTVNVLLVKRQIILSVLHSRKALIYK